MTAGGEPRGRRIRHDAPGDAAARGNRIRREVLGDEHVDAAQRATTEFTAPFQDFITRTAWGDIWARPGLDRRTRSAITLAILTTLRAEGEIAMHVRAALRNGLSVAEIAEVLLHTAVYAGVPAANSAFSIAGHIVAEADAGARNDDEDGQTAATRSTTAGTGPDSPATAPHPSPRKGTARRRRSK